MLFGVAVVGVLAAVRVTVIGTRMERDHANAHQWLQSASEVVRAVDGEGCKANPADPPSPSTAAADYEAAIVAAGVAPPDWSGTIAVSAPVRWWDADAQAYVPEAQELNCDVERIRVQLVELTVRNPDGDVVEQVEVVKRV